MLPNPVIMRNRSPLSFVILDIEPIYNRAQVVLSIFYQIIGYGNRIKIIYFYK
jgi:hypothetical protein